MIDHPGKIIRAALEPFGLTVAGAAQWLGVGRQALSNVLNGNAAISPTMAIRLSMALGRDPYYWYGLRCKNDLAKAMRQAGKIRVKRLGLMDQQK